jgi:quinol monooxygenase YgiN
MPQVAGTTREGVGVTIKAIGEFTVQPGRREEFVSLFESLVAQHMPSMRAAGCLDSTLFAVADDPDKAVEIADWESAEARDEAMQSGAMGAFAPLFELLAAPFSATVVKPLH